MKPSEGIARIDASTTRAHQAIDHAASMFSGTVPPRPWPSPALYKALEDVAAVRDRLDVFVRHGDPDFNAKTPQVARVVREIQTRIEAVDAATLALEERRDVVIQRTPRALVSQITTAAKSPKWIALGVLGYLFWNEKRGRRR